MTVKIALLAVTAAAALIGAAVVGVPSTADRTGDKPFASRAAR